MKLKIMESAAVRGAAAAARRELGDSFQKLRERLMEDVMTDQEVGDLLLRTLTSLTKTKADISALVLAEKTLKASERGPKETTLDKIKEMIWRLADQQKIQFTVGRKVALNDSTPIKLDESASTRALHKEVASKLTSFDLLQDRLENDVKMRRTMKW